MNLVIGLVGALDRLTWCRLRRQVRIVFGDQLSPKPSARQAAHRAMAPCSELRLEHLHGSSTWGKGDGNVRDILATKGTHVMTIGADASVLDAAVLMNERKIGSLVVMAAGRVIGIITERDILTRVVVPRRDSGQTVVADVMTTEVVCC
jgi:CBS-domain-containing membrane protein